MATRGFECRVSNTHPFVVNNVAFAHNGSIGPVGELRNMLSQSSLEAIRGDTDSELYFALIRERLADGMPLAIATSTAVGQIRSVAERASLNALLLTPEELIVIHNSEGASTPLDEFKARGFALSALPSSHHDDYHRMYWRRTENGNTVFASSGVDDPRWSALPESCVVRVALFDAEVCFKPSPLSVT